MLYLSSARRALVPNGECPSGCFLEPALGLVATVVLEAVVVKPSWWVPHSAAAWWELQTAVESCWFNEEKCWNGFLHCTRSCRVEVGLSLQRGGGPVGPLHLTVQNYWAPGTGGCSASWARKLDSTKASPSAWEVFSVWYYFVLLVWAIPICSWMGCVIAFGSALRGLSILKHRLLMAEVERVLVEEPCERFHYEQKQRWAAEPSACGSVGEVVEACESSQHVTWVVPVCNLGFRELPAFLVSGDSLDQWKTIWLS